ncbi:hypothetical protein ABPG75_009095 [Micractinium tetrahymenae]
MDPASFSRVGDQSAVTAQPQTPEQRKQAMQALISCPTFSIHCRQRQPGELRAAQESFPLPVPGCTRVHWTGYAAESSFGATAYFIRRPEGNILVDVPRWTPLLAQRLQQLGGVRWIFLTHRDDVGDHQAWAEATGAQRIIHRSEANRRQGTDKCEVQLEGEGPWQLTASGSVQAVPHSSSSGGSNASSHGGDAGTGSSSGTGTEEDVLLLFTPGHTAGCLSLLYRPDQALFTGDHLAWSNRLQRLTIFRAYNWHSVPQQLDSVAALRDLDFVHVLPGHGRRAVLADAADRRRQIDELLAAEGWRGGA